MTFNEFEAKRPTDASYTMPKSVAHWRAKVSSYSRSRSEDDPAMIEARHNLKLAGVYEAFKDGLDGVDLSEDERKLFMGVLWSGPFRRAAENRDRAAAEAAADEAPPLSEHQQAVIQGLLNPR